MTDALELFHVDEPPAPPPVEKLSPDRRRTQRQREALERGAHPLSLARIDGPPVLVHPDAGQPDGPTCGSCRFRTIVGWRDRRYAKCGWLPPTWSADQAARRTPPRANHGAGTDIRASWPGCRDWELGDPKVGPDAARCRPS